VKTQVQDLKNKYVLYGSKSSENEDSEFRPLSER
jgi:hypothetical protein